MPDINIQYFDKLPSHYQNVVTKLLEKLDKNEDAVVQKRLLAEFSHKYTMIPELWEYYYRFAASHTEQDEILCRSLTHFVTTWAADLITSKDINVFTWNNVVSLDHEFHPIIFNFTAPLKNKEEKLISFLHFPHKNLPVVYKLYEEISASPNVEMNKIWMKHFEIYKKLKEYFANNLEEYLDTVMKIDNHDVQYENIELLLGSRPYDKDVWEKYFKLLEERNENEKLFDLYHRYNGLFLDDKDVQGKIEKLAATIDSKKSLTTSSEEEEEASNPANSLDLKSVIKNFSLENAKFQALPFKKPLSAYIYDNCNPAVMRKLQTTTKHFLRLFPILIIHRLEVSAEKKNFHKNSLSLPPNNKLFKKLNNITLTNSLFLDNVKASKIIPKISNCYIRFLRVRDQELKMDEYQFFVQSGKIELLSLQGVVDENNDPVPLENLLAMAPKVVYLNFFSDQLTPDTFQNLLKLKFESKILHFSLYGILELINVEACIEFFKQNLGPNANVYIEFDDMYPEDDFHQLYTAVEAMKDEWEEGDKTPQIELFCEALFH